jgi:uncharacterized protein
LSERRALERFKGMTPTFKPRWPGPTAVTTLLFAAFTSSCAHQETTMMNRMTSKNTVAWFKITGQDGARLRSFYGQLFGWKTNDVAPAADYGVTDSPERGIGGAIGAAPKGSPGLATFFIQVDDLEASLREAERLGGKIIEGPRSFPDKRPASRGHGTVTFAYFTDPEGHVLGLCSGILK